MSFTSQAAKWAAASILATIASSAIAEQTMYGNVAAKDLYILLADHVLVSHMANAEKYGPDVMTLQVGVYRKDGNLVQCNAFDGKVDGKTGTLAWAPVIIDEKSDRERYPLLQVTDANGPGYGLNLYNAKTGQLDAYVAEPDGWTLINKGHLQKDVPAAVYTMCPDFPSAESLGTTVNERQTSTNYRAMVAQDPGKRVLCPDLVSNSIPEKY